MRKNPIATLGLVCSISAYFWAALFAVLLNPLGQGGGASAILWVGAPALLLSIAGIICGNVALRRIRRSEGVLGGQGAAWNAIALGGLALLGLAPCVGLIFYNVLYSIFH